MLFPIWPRGGVENAVAPGGGLVVGPGPGSGLDGVGDGLEVAGQKGGGNRHGNCGNPGVVVVVGGGVVVGVGVVVVVGCGTRVRGTQV